MSIHLAKRAFNAQSLLCRALTENSKIITSKYHEKVQIFKLNLTPCTNEIRKIKNFMLIR